LQKQVGEARGKVKCPLCDKWYKRRDSVYAHIRKYPDTSHRRLADIIKEKWCLICGIRYGRLAERVKHEQTVHGMSDTNKSRAEVMTLQLDTSTPPTNNAQVHNIELDNSASPANVKSASGTPRFSINMAGSCSTELGEIKILSTKTGRRGLIDKFSTDSVELNSFPAQIEEHRACEVHAYEIRP